MRAEVHFFNERATPYTEEYERETPEGYSFRVRRERVLELLPHRKGEKLLDIAGGPGVMVEGVAERGYTIECVDAAPEMIEVARKKYAHVPSASFSVGDVYALPHTDESFDAVTAMGLVEYLDQQDKAMAEMARVTKQGGAVIVTFPNRPSIWRGWARFLRGITAFPRTLIKKVLGKQPYPITHREYTEDEARAYMERHGLTPNKVVYYNFKVMPYPFDKWFPLLTVKQSALLEQPGRTAESLLATAFIVHATKR